LSSDKSGTSGLAGRYASALFDLAVADKQLDAVTGNLEQLSSMIGESEDLRVLLGSPLISRDDQTKAMLNVAVKAGFEPLVHNFIGVVADNRRLYVLLAMINAFQEILKAYRGEVIAKVFSASELSDKQVKALGDQLKKAIGTRVSIDTSVDPELLGGLVVKVGSRMIDSSLRTKLQQLRLAMIGVE
jgi:F-type H+-transporting ATPase subunit delta